MSDESAAPSYSGSGEISIFSICCFDGGSKHFDPDDPDVQGLAAIDHDEEVVRREVTDPWGVQFGVQLLETGQRTSRLNRASRSDFSSDCGVFHAANICSKQSVNSSVSLIG
jgi:hypothetical protein